MEKSKTPTTFKEPPMRQLFVSLVHEAMRTNPKIWVVTADLGFGIWDKVWTDFPKRFINVGAAEQVMAGVGVGLATAGMTPVLYSITPFLLYRPFETIRNYLHRDGLGVKLIGSGRDKDYHHDGFSHWAEEDRQIMEVLSGVKSSWPESNQEMKRVVKKLLSDDQPWYLNLRR